MNKKEMILKCIGCGYCCLETPCSTAMELHGPVKTCPELVWNGRRYRCKIIDLRREKGLVNEFCCRPSIRGQDEIRYN